MTSLYCIARIRGVPPKAIDAIFYDWCNVVKMNLKIINVLFEVSRDGGEAQSLPSLSIYVPL